MGAAQARVFVTQLRRAGLPYREALTEYYRKYFVALNPLIVILIATGVGGRFRKNVLLLSLLASLLLSVVYYVGQMITLILAKNALIPPLAGAGFSFLVFLVGGLADPAHRQDLKGSPPVLYTLRLPRSDCAARAGILELAHGRVETPVFMPVGTNATVKAIGPEGLEALGVSLILANAYHLYLRPGAEVIRERRRPARLHGLGAQHPDRFRRLPDLLPGLPAAHHGGRGRSSARTWTVPPGA